jgi:hypothetical protein
MYPVKNILILVFGILTITICVVVIIALSIQNRKQASTKLVSKPIREQSTLTTTRKQSPLTTTREQSPLTTTREHVSNASDTRAMVIVEPRKHALLKDIINNFNEKMDASWDLHVFHGTLNGSHANDAVKEARTKRNVYLHTIGVDNLNAAQYNQLFKQLSFWDTIPSENILVFQTDSVLCDTNIEDFTHFDYIGCSYNDYTIGTHAVPRNWRGGNKYRSFYGIGGLSFRKKSFMEACIRALPNIPDDYAEDVFFSECVAKDGNSRPPNAGILASFCAQHSFPRESLGVHKPVTMSAAEKKKMVAYCPSAAMLI